MNEIIKLRIKQIRNGEVPYGYKHSGKDIIPTDWIKATFSKLAKIESGLVSPTDEPYFSMHHVGPDNIMKDTGRIVDTKLAGDLGLISGKYFFDSNSIVYSKIRPNLNKVCIPDFNGICSADCYSIKPTKDIDKVFLFNLMRSFQFYKQAVSCSMRTGMPKINQNDLSIISFVLPKEKIEQQIIAEILTTCDKVIELKEKHIAEKQRQKKYLMQQLLTGQKRLARFTGGWETKKLGSLFVERNEIRCEDLELLAITGNKGVLPRKELELKDNSSEDKSKYRKICVGDIGYNTMRMWQGVSAYSNYEGIVSPAYTILKPSPTINARYFAYLFKMPETIFLFYRYSQGLVNDTRNLKYENFRKIQVMFPAEIAEQNAIVEVLATADHEIELLQRDLEQEKLKKKALMQLLLTGIVRVNT